MMVKVAGFVLVPSDQLQVAWAKQRYEIVAKLDERN
jgi:hypothetical protein